MATVSFKCSPAGVNFRINVDGMPVVLSNGEGEKTLKGGREHALQYYVRGMPGTSYAVQITKPPEAKGRWSATLDGTGYDANQVWFWLDEPAGGV